MHVKLFCVILTMCLLLCGCSWMSNNFVSITPHRNDNATVPSEIITISSYQEMVDVIVNLVENGTDSCVLFAEAYELSDLDWDMRRCIRKIMHNTSVGAYAVDSIDYEVGTGAGLTTVALEIQYRHGRNEIRQIRCVDTLESAKDIIENELKQFQNSITIRVLNYQKTDFVQLIQNYYNHYPDYMIELPQIAVQVFPETGLDRIVEIQLSYLTSRDSLKTMQEYTRSVFSSAYLYVIGDTDPHVKFSQLFSFLMERYEYTFETSITPAYSLLRHGVGDSKAFASVYARMCNNANLTCYIVSGTKSGEPHFWNIVQIGDQYYHVDLLSSAAAGGFLLLTDHQMNGYVWDYSSYPICGGA